MKSLTEITEWKDLSTHYSNIENDSMRDYFSHESDRFSQFSLHYDEILFDYSRNRINAETIDLLCKLANAIDLPSKIEAMFTGSVINTTEKRAALHTALRDPSNSPILVNGKDVKPAIFATRKKMQAIVEKIHQKQWLGATGKPIEHIINIGIGGSYLGPKMCVHALKAFNASHLKFHFISTVDKTALDDVLEVIDPETSLFILSSKTFSTIETITNANSIFNWLSVRLSNANLAPHFIAVTTAVEKAKAFGIPNDQILPMWDWVGGRYSVWSAIGLPLMLFLGVKQFEEFLQGGHSIDRHFRHADFAHNIPVILALLSVWYMNFFGARAQAIIPYVHRLRYLVPYLQQAEMESNGKRTRLDGEIIDYSTGPIIFGEEGCNGQHAYHQLLLQGQHLVPIDFITCVRSTSGVDDIHQDVLLASVLSQAQAMMRGKTLNESYDELIGQGVDAVGAKALAAHRAIPGNRPSNIILLEKLSPKNLGALIAIYEHKIFVQGAIWQINPFDQWGVELGKQLLPEILSTLQQSAPHSVSSPNAEMIRYLKKCRSPA